MLLLTSNWFSIPHKNGYSVVASVRFTVSKSSCCPFQKPPSPPPQPPEPCAPDDADEGRVQHLFSSKRTQYTLIKEYTANFRGRDIMS